MSSNRIVRSKSLDKGVTPRRLYQVVLPEPGSPIVKTTKPLGDFSAACSAGGVASDSGWVSTTTFFSSTGAIGAGTTSSDFASTAGSATRAGVASGYEGLRGAGWFAGSSCPLLPVDSESFGP